MNVFIIPGVVDVDVLLLGAVSVELCRNNDAVSGRTLTRDGGDLVEEHGDVSFIPLLMIPSINDIGRVNLFLVVVSMTYSSQRKRERESERQL